MSRAERTYGDRSQATRTFDGLDVSQPEAGFFQMRLGAGRPYLAIEIRFAPPLDPLTGEVMDRGPRWQCFVMGEYADDWDRYWPACTRSPISQAEHDHIIKTQAWAKEHAPNSSLATGRKVDLLSRSEVLPF